MIKEELYHNTVDILVKAYFNDTLEHSNCYACAVGNMVAAHNGFKYTEEKFWDGFELPMWAEVFRTDDEGWQRKMPSLYVDIAKEQIDSTGYTWRELAKIEFAFETAPKGKSKDEWMFNGLMAAIDALDVIHENKDNEVTVASKRKFVPAIN